MFSPGRNSLLTNIYRQINRFFSTPVEGSQRSVTGGNSFSSVRKNYDLEIYENACRNTDVARSLIELTNYCPEVTTAIDVIVGDVFSNADGDDQGFKIDDLTDDGTPVDPTVKEILDALFDNVIGGLTLEPAVERMLSYGDSFVSLGIGKDSTGQLGINKLLVLPTWEMFRIEDDQANLQRFEQRRSLSDSKPAFTFHPAQVIHFRYRKKSLYGRPLFGVDTLGDWERLKSATDNLSRASDRVGVNPSIHTMPPNANKEYKDAYKEDYENELASGVVTDVYLMPGATVAKLSASDPDLNALVQNVLLWRSRIIMRSRLPLWMFSGMPTLQGSAAKEISEQPSLAYARHINRVRMCLSEGIKQICLTELILKGVPVEKREFRIVHPKIYVSTNQQLDPQQTKDPTNPSLKTKGDTLSWLNSLDKDQLLKQLVESDK